MNEITMTVAKTDSGYDVQLEQWFYDGSYQMNTICHDLSFELAHLIAASSELYKALQYMVNVCPPIDEIGEEAVNQAQKALIEASKSEI